MAAALFFAAGPACTSASSTADSGTETVQTEDIMSTSALMQKSFCTLLENGNLKWENDEISAEAEGTRGILIKGNNDTLAETRFTIDEEYDFGTYRIQRIQISGLCEAGKDIRVSVYLDGSDTPAAVMALPEKTEDSWITETNVSVDVTDLDLTGSHTVEITACAYEDDQPVYEGSSEIYLRDIQFAAETIPLVTINIDESQGTIEAMNSDYDHNTMCYGSVTIEVPESYDGSYNSTYTGGTYELDYIKGRGNSTWRHGVKHPYKIKLEESEDLFGMGQNKHWALIANDFDITYARNAFTYSLGEELGMEFTPQFISVDVVMNGEYLGNYLLCETIRIDENRVDIDDLLKDDSDLTGGYLLGASYNGADAESYLFTTRHLNEFNVTSPASEDSTETEEENKYIEEYIQRVENAVYGDPDPETGEVEDPFDLMDLDSAVKYYWIQELSQNADFMNTASTYCYKVRDGKLYWGPLWDFDIAWDGTEFTETSVWQGEKEWFSELMKNDVFRDAVTEYWNTELYPKITEIMQDGGMFDQMIERIAYSAVNDHMQWGFQIDDYSTEYENADYTSAGRLVLMDETAAYDLYMTNVEKLRDSITGKAEWCSEYLDTIRPDDVEVIFRVNGETVFEKTGTMNTLFVDLPDTAECEDPDQVFAGWYYAYAQSGDYSFVKIGDYVCPQPANTVLTDDGYVLYIDAVFAENSTEIVPYTTVSFAQTEYDISLSETKEDGSVLIPYENVQENADYHSLKVMTYSDEIMDIEICADGLKITPLSEGEAELSVSASEDTASLIIRITE